MWHLLPGAPLCGPLFLVSLDRLHVVPASEMMMSGSVERKMNLLGCRTRRTLVRNVHIETYQAETFGMFGVWPESSFHVSSEQKLPYHLEGMWLQRPRGAGLRTLVMISTGQICK